MKKRVRGRTATGVTVTGAVVLLGALLQGSSAVAQAEPAHSAPVTATCVGTRPAGSLSDRGAEDFTPLDRTLAHVGRMGESARYAAVYTGLSVDEEDRATDVYRMPSASFDADLCGAAEKGVTVRLHDTDANRTDLEALADRIAEDMNRWNGTFDLREVGVDEAGFVFVGVDDPTTAAPLLKKAFGARHIEVGYAEQASLLSTTG
ncbi:hypothetical protein [Streptomyces mirabilis]|uniref:hypothetical protein n=1 Tax=Streptomyces mirabilis TaxID=68239 RepID=UPI0036AB3C2A